MRLIILPQALRVIVPPLTSQYLNLTKNSSLGIAVGYADLVHGFGGISLNQTGQAIECMAITMATYLTISLTISLFMNIPSLEAAFLEYTIMHTNIDYKYLLAPLPILFTFYIILNRKKLLFYELYLFLLYYAFILSPIFITEIPASVVGRILLGLWVILSLTTCKMFAGTNYYVIFHLKKYL